MSDATPALADFLARYQEDDNEWWMVGCGDHLNLFEEALTRAEKAEVALDRVRAENASLRRIARNDSLTVEDLRLRTAVRAALDGSSE